VWTIDGVVSPNDATQPCQQSVIWLPFTLFSPVRACFCNFSICPVLPAQIRFDRAADTLLTGLLTLW
jgi:hypothetical protein